MSMYTDKLKEVVQGGEQWKQDHLEVKRLWEVEDGIKTLLGILHKLAEIDIQYHTELFDTGEEPHAEVQECLEYAYKTMVKHADVAIQRAEQLENLGYEIELLDSLREQRNTAAGALMDDEEFFQGIDIESLASDAIREFESGQCGPLP